MSGASMATAESQELATLFVDALRVRDFERLAAVFHPHVRSRLLIPSGLMTPLHVKGLMEKFRQWFGEADQFAVEQADAALIGGCLCIRYHIRLHEHGCWYHVEQQTYSHLEAGRIERLDLLCSGFQPDAATS